MDPTGQAHDDPGVGGASARREFEGRRLARERRVKQRLGKVLGNVVLAVTDEPQSTRAWAQGASGEAKLAETLAAIPNLKVLNDRRAPGTRGNIDHLVIAAAGLFVVDAKNYRGTIEVRDVGGLFKIDKRLFVGRRDCSKLADNMGWQVAAVVKALAGVVLDVQPTVVPVLCFIDGEWPLLFPPKQFEGVRLESGKSIKKLLAGPEILGPSAVEGVHRALAIAFPPK
jgi:hypothetical protein